MNRYGLASSVCISVVGAITLGSLAISYAFAQEPSPSRATHSLRITHAVCGANNSWKDVTDVLQRMVQGDILAVDISQPFREFGGDPANGRVKTLVVEYTYDGEAGELTLQEQFPVAFHLRLPSPQSGSREALSVISSSGLKAIEQRSASLSQPTENAGVAKPYVGQSVSSTSFPSTSSRPNSPPALVYKACALVSGSNGRGSGFWVNSNTFVTCLHVVAEGGDNLSISTIEGGSFHIASVINYSTNDDDVVVVTTIPDNPNWLSLKDDTDAGTRIWSIGNSEGARVLKTDDGEIAGVGDSVLEVTAQIRPGCSGGPIVDADGNVLGMSAFLKFPMVSITDTQGHYKHDFSLADARKFAIRSFTIQKYLSATSWPITVKEIQESECDRECTPLLLQIHKFIAQPVYDALVTRLEWNQNVVHEPDRTVQQSLYPNAQRGQLGFNSYVFQTVPGEFCKTITF